MKTPSTPPPPPPALVPGQTTATCQGYVALTFDDGPTTLTDKYLKVLKTHDAPATFFNIGQNEKMYPTQVTHEIDAGEIVGNHTQTHPHMTKISPEQRTAELTEPIRIHEQYGHRAFTFWRPPYGETTPEIRQQAETLGMAEVIWDLDSKDYDTPNPKKVVAQSMGMKDGDIILMHDGKPQTLAALPTIIKRYYAKGLCFGKLARTDQDRKAENGKMYAVKAVAP